MPERRWRLRKGWKAPAELFDELDLFWIGMSNDNRLENLIVKQIDDFHSGRRQNESMKIVVASLTDEEKRQLGEYYAGLRVPSNAKPELGGNLARATAPVVYCASDAAGVQFSLTVAQATASTTTSVSSPAVTR